MQPQPEMLDAQVPPRIFPMRAEDSNPLPDLRRAASAQGTAEAPVAPGTRLGWLLWPALATAAGFEAAVWLLPS